MDGEMLVIAGLVVIAFAAGVALTAWLANRVVGAAIAKALNW